MLTETLMLRGTPKNTLITIAARVSGESTAANIIVNVDIVMPEDVAVATVHVQHQHLVLMKLVLNGHTLPDALLASFGWDEGVMAGVYDAVSMEGEKYHTWWLKENQAYENRMARRDHADQMALEQDDSRERMRSF